MAPIATSFSPSPLTVILPPGTNIGSQLTSKALNLAQDFGNNLHLPSIPNIIHTATSFLSQPGLEIALPKINLPTIAGSHSISTLPSGQISINKQLSIQPSVAVVHPAPQVVVAPAPHVFVAPAPQFVVAPPPVPTFVPKFVPTFVPPQEVVNVQFVEKSHGGFVHTVESEKQSFEYALPKVEEVHSSESSGSIAHTETHVDSSGSSFDHQSGQGFSEYGLPKPAEVTRTPVFSSEASVPVLPSLPHPDYHPAVVQSIPFTNGLPSNGNFALALPIATLPELPPPHTFVSGPAVSSVPFVNQRPSVQGSPADLSAPLQVLQGLPPTNSVTGAIELPPNSQVHVQDEKSQYTNAFSSPDGTMVSEQGKLITTNGGWEYVLAKTGTYEYTSPEGLPVKVKWIADENGYRVLQ